MSQSETERVWHKPNAAGGVDVITITLSSPIADPSDNSTSAEFGHYFEFPQVFIYGNSTSALGNNLLTRKETSYVDVPGGEPGISVDTVDPYTGQPANFVFTYTYSYTGGSFQALLLNSDGTTEMQIGSIPSGTDGEVTTGGVTTGTEPYTSGGTASPSYPGQILLALGAFDNIATGEDFEDINTIDLVADPSM